MNKAITPNIKLMYFLKVFGLLMFFLVFLTNVRASHDIHPSGAKATAMGGVGVAESNIWSAFNNQAGLADLESMSAGIIYENKFLLKELGVKAGAFAMPVNNGVFGLSFSQFGFHLYNDNKIGLAYAMPLSDRLNAGVQLDYLLTQIAEDYGRKGVFTFEVGLMAKLSDNIILAGHVFNPINVKLTDYVEERVPAKIRMGLKYILSEKANMQAEIEKDINHKAVVRFGVDYEIVENVYVRTGFGTNPSVFAFGFGVNVNNFKIDFGTSKHNALGYSPALSLMYNFRNN